MEKLELKHICPYLPYELKIFDIETKEIGIINDLLYSIYATRYRRLDLVINSPYVKPILRPISDLYREIDGKIGIEIIGKHYTPDGKVTKEDDRYFFGWNTHVCDDFQGYEIGWLESVGWFGLFYDTYDYENQNEHFTGDYIPYSKQIADYLDEHHYDWRYDLIRKGLAIDKNTIQY